MSASTTPKLSESAKREARKVLDAAARRQLGERLEQAKPTGKRP
jgi:hypothetical protein